MLIVQLAPRGTTCRPLPTQWWPPNRIANQDTGQWEISASGDYLFLPGQIIPHPENLTVSTDKMRPPPTLPNELLEEVFMRLPPDEPACLVRASLANKHWFGLFTGPAFRTRYRDFHGAPSMLGFFRSWTPYSAWVEERLEPIFVSTSNFVACFPDEEEDEEEYDVYGEAIRKEEEGWVYSGQDAWDCRHGRAILGVGDRDELHTELVVLDPVTGYLWELDVPKDYHSHRAAVLCAVPGCHHRTCHEGPFRVVVVGMNLNKGDSVACLYVSLPSDEWNKPRSQWSKPCPGLHLGFDAIFQPMPPVLTQDALYFMIVDDDEDDHVGILKYNLRSKCLSLIDAPLVETDIARNAILMGMEDDSLGFAHLDGVTLNVWSRKMGSDGTMTWTHLRVVNLEELLPIQNLEQRLRLIGSVEGSDIIFVTTDFGICEISLKSLEWKKIWNRENLGALLPYMSFNDPSEMATPCEAAL